MTYDTSMHGYFISLKNKEKKLGYSNLPVELA